TVVLGLRCGVGAGAGDEQGDAHHQGGHGQRGQRGPADPGGGGGAAVVVAGTGGLGRGGGHGGAAPVMGAGRARCYRRVGPVQSGTDARPHGAGASTTDEESSVGEQIHPFDDAVTLTAVPGGPVTGRTTEAYANMVGPYGGITAATMLRAVL